MTAADPIKPTSGGGRPAVYRLANGKRVPGVTTILGKFKDPGGLLHWAWQCGVDGIDYREKRDDAGDVGSIAHAWIEQDIQGYGVGLPIDSDSPKHQLAASALEAFRAWRRNVKLEIIATEWPLVSELHSFGGTLDALGLADRLVVLLDWKSSNRVYTEHVAQCAAYRQLVRENTKHVVNGAHLLRVGKELGDFSHHYIPPEALDMGWDRFLASKWLYETDAKLKKAMGL